MQVRVPGLGLGRGRIKALLEGLGGVVGVFGLAVGGQAQNLVEALRGSVGDGAQPVWVGF